MVVGLSFVFERQSSIGNMIQIFKPLEEGYGHTTSIDVEVRNYQDVSFQENFVGSRSSGTIGSFRDDLYGERQIY